MQLQLIKVTDLKLMCDEFGITYNVKYTKNKLIEKIIEFVNTGKQILLEIQKNINTDNPQG